MTEHDENLEPPAWYAATMQREAKLINQVNLLEREHDATAIAVASQGGQLDEIAKDLKALSKAVQSRDKLSWPLVLSFVGVSATMLSLVIVFGTIVGRPWTQRVEGNERSIKAMRGDRWSGSMMEKYVTLDRAAKKDAAQSIQDQMTRNEAHIEGRLVREMEHLDERIKRLIENDRAIRVILDGTNKEVAARTAWVKYLEAQVLGHASPQVK